MREGILETEGGSVGLKRSFNGVLELSYGRETEVLAVGIVYLF